MGRNCLPSFSGKQRQLPFLRTCAMGGWRTFGEGEIHCRVGLVLRHVKYFQWKGLEIISLGALEPGIYSNTTWMLQEKIFPPSCQLFGKEKKSSLFNFIMYYGKASSLLSLHPSLRKQQRENWREHMVSSISQSSLLLLHTMSSPHK